MTNIWRKMQGIETHQSVSDAENLSMMVYLSLNFDLVRHTKSVSCRYTIDGDTVAWDHFETSDEALNWIHGKVLDELDINQKALNNEYKLK